MYQMKDTSGRKKVKSIRLWIKNTMQEVKRIAIWALRESLRGDFSLDLMIERISQIKASRPKIPVSAH